MKLLLGSGTAKWHNKQKDKRNAIIMKGINIERARPAHCNCESHQRRYLDLLNYIFETSLFVHNKSSIANIVRLLEQYLNNKILMI